MGGYHLQRPLSKKARRVSAGKLCRLFGFYSSLTKGISLCFFIICLLRYFKKSYWSTSNLWLTFQSVPLNNLMVLVNEIIFLFPFYVPQIPGFQGTEMLLSLNTWHALVSRVSNLPVGLKLFAFDIRKFFVYGDHCQYPKP